MTDAAPDFDTLFDTGRQRLGALAGERWSDHNFHDPGITILEYLCFALQDIGYRARLPVAHFPAARPRLHGPAANLLTCRATTDLDYRRLLADIPGIHNTWLSRGAGDTAGLITLTLEVSEECTAVERAEIRVEATRRFVSNRSLGEDISTVTFAQRHPLSVELSLTLKPGTDSKTELLDCVGLLSELISPPLVFNDPASTAVGMGPLDEIYDGPWLAHGVVAADQAKSSERRSTLSLRPFRDRIMKLEQIHSVDILRLRGSGGAIVQVVGDDRYALDDQAIYRLSANTSRFSATDGIRTLTLSTEVLRNYLWQLSAGRQKCLAAASTPPDPGSPPSGIEALGDYDSLQTTFPTIYGLRPGDLPASATEERRALARQLRGFLNIFDQLLAQSTKQIAALPALMEQPLGPGFYGIAPVKDAPLPEDTVGDSLTLAGAVADRLNESAETADLQERLANHILARFGTRLGTLPEGACQENSSLLARLPALDKERGAGSNYLCPALQHDRATGLQRRLNAFFFADETRIDALETAPLQISRQRHETGTQISYQLDLYTEEHALLLTGCETYGTEEEAGRAAHQFKLLGSFRSAYHKSLFDDTDGTPHYTVQLLNHRGLALARSPAPLASESRADALITDCRARLAAKERNTRLYVVEPILLRASTGDPDGAASTRDLAYRALIIAPETLQGLRAETSREEILMTARENTPAHIALQCAWLGEADMLAFESAYFQWVDDTWLGASSLRQSRVQLISVLRRIGLWKDQ